MPSYNKGSSYSGNVAILTVACLLSCFNMVAQTPPAITGPGGATSAAFWYLGGVSPNCCSDITNKYWTVWAVNLTTNTSDPTPTIVWSTDSSTKVSIAPNGTTGATLTALGHSSAGTTYDINIWVTVDGVQSANFPVYINTPWTQSHTGPTASTTCTALFGLGTPNGWVGQVTNSLTDLAGNQVIPIDARETFENDKALYTGENWGVSSEASWPATDWSSNSFVDTYAMCWGGSPAPTPATTSWNTSGTTAINSDTQKYWMGSTSRFQGECSQRHALTWYTDHAVLSSVTTPVTTQSTCASGSGFLN